MDHLPASPGDPFPLLAAPADPQPGYWFDPSVGPSLDDNDEAEITRGRALLEDAGIVLSTRRRLDDLLLDALTGQGLAAPELAGLEHFLESDLLRSAQAALSRLAGRATRDGGIQ